jgi:VanZ family protein
MNAAIVAPLTFLASLSWPLWSWRDWTAVGFLGAVAVELTQGLLLPDRQAAFSDIVANTAGALVGAVVGALVVALVRPMLRTRTAR